MEMLRLEEVSKRRRNPLGQEVDILRGVSLSLAAGHLQVIIGPSGSGKSTLIRMVNRLDEPCSGRILLGGVNISDLDPLILRGRVAMVLQKPYMFEGTVLDNLQRGFAFRGLPLPGADDPRIASVMELCRLPVDFLPRAARTLSLGQQQRVSLARALATGPELLLLDEPTSSLDRPTGDRLGETLRDICRMGRLTILMVTHDLRLAGRVADRLAFLEDGRILEQGSAQDLLNRPASAELRRFLDTPNEGVE